MSQDRAPHNDPQPALDTLQAIRPQEGQQIRVVGLLTPPKQGKDLYKLLLRDGKQVVIGHLSSDAQVDRQRLEALAGESVSVTGRVYFDHIPDDYHIYARIGAPYLVDILNIDVL